jgi:cation-transporting P-type ATPase 13A2
MWTNGSSSLYFKPEALKQALGWLMASIACLTVFSTWVLVTPTISVQLILDLMYLPWTARVVLMLMALVNVLASFAYEAWIHEPIATAVQTLWKAYGRRRRREGRIYDSVGRG